MCKNSGKISVFSVRCSEGGRKVLEIIVGSRGKILEGIMP